MYPANQYMDPYYACCRDNAPYPYYPPPGWEAGDPRMAMDSSCRPPSYGPWPYSGSTSHSCPTEFHSCCNHTYPPGYYSFRPPFPQERPPPHLYYHGPFPHHPSAYPSYFVSPPPYPVGQTPYSYDKFKSHCCGCPNHVCHGGEKSNLKIEEEMPEVKPESEQKGAENSSIIRHPNYQNPVMWFPSGNIEDKGNRRSSELPPQLFKSWVPESGERTGDVNQQDRDNQNAKQFQWPIIWMPAGYDEPKQEAKQLKEIDESPKVSEDAPPSPKIKIIPLSWFENGHHDQRPAAKDGSRDHNERSPVTDQSTSTGHRHDTTVDGNFKTIPVVPMEPNNENKLVGQNYKTIPVVPDKEGDAKKVGTCRTIPVISQKEIGEKKSDGSENKEEKKASSAKKEVVNGKTNNVEPSKAKHSKLPPVCLRVDPLPRKKSGNGSSRSLSPPTRKDREKGKKDIKEAESQNRETEVSEPKEGSNVSEVKEKSPDETDKRMEPRNEIVQATSVKHAQEEQSTSMVDQKVQPSVNFEEQENVGAKTLQECDKSTKEDEMKIQDEAEKFARRLEINLSEPDAAVRIQSAYRGYHVRRWQPLEKLRKIKTVHEQMQDVKKQLQDLQASSKQPTVKEQVAISETIMNLLLKLDTIQGLHPSVREARKSVAQELVCLQEKLDSMCTQLSGERNYSESEEEKPERIDNAIQTTAHVSTAEAFEEEKFAGAGEEQGLSSINSKEMMHDEVSSGVSMELRQDAVMREAASSGHSTEQKHQMEESNTISREESPEEEKDAAKGEGKEVSSVDFMEPLHDAALSEESSVLIQCSASNEHNSHTEESNTGVSPATEGSTTAMATSSMESGVAVDKDDPVEGQVWESAAVESSVLKHDVAPAEEDQCKEPSAPFVHLEDSCVYLKDAEPHEHDSPPADDSIVHKPQDRPEEAWDADMHKQVADTMQDSVKEPDGTPVPLVGDTNNVNYVATTDVDKSDKFAQSPSPLLEETPQSDSALEQTVLKESEATKQHEVSGKDDSLLVGHQSEPHVEDPTGGSAIGEEPLAIPLENEAETMEDALNVAGALGNMVAEPTLPEGESSELPCEHDGTGVQENPDSKVSSESQNEVQKVCTDGDKTSGGTEASEAVECNEMLEEAPVCATVCATGANSTELEADNPKDDAGVQTASEEAAPVSLTHGGPRNDDEKRLAQENEKLNDMVQKLLASGNDQMGVITELSEKVKTLERKLARKKRPKVRVHRPARNATANVH